MSTTSWRSFSVLSVNLLLLSTTALCAHFRVCEPYSDHRGRHHFGFHCPRLSDNKTYVFCCRRDGVAFKYCCNDTEFQSVTHRNLTAASDELLHNNYTALVGVWIYGFLIMVLLALDFLYFSALNYDLCRVYLEKWGLGGRWLKRAQSQWNSAAPRAREPILHPIVLAHHPRHNFRKEALMTSVTSYHTSTAWRFTPRGSTLNRCGSFSPIRKTHDMDDTTSEWKTPCTALGGSGKSAAPHPDLMDTHLGPPRTCALLGT